MSSNFVLGPPEVLWFDVRVDKNDPKSMTVLEYWTGRTPDWILKDAYPAGLTIHERNRRRFIFHSEYVAFLKATSTRKELQPDGNSQDHSERFTRDARGRIAAVARR